MPFGAFDCEWIRESVLKCIVFVFTPEEYSHSIQLVLSSRSNKKMSHSIFFEDNFIQIMQQTLFAKHSK